MSRNYSPYLNATPDFPCVQDVLRHFFSETSCLVSYDPDMNSSIFIHKEVRRVEQVTRLAIERIRRATSIRDLTSSMHVNVRAELRALKHLMPSIDRARQEASRRAKAIVRKQLEVLASADNTSDFLAKRGPLMSDWRYLSGHFPRLAVYVREESSRLWVMCVRHEFQRNQTARSADAN